LFTRLYTYFYNFYNIYLIYCDIILKKIKRKPSMETGLFKNDVSKLIQYSDLLDMGLPRKWVSGKCTIFMLECVQENRLLVPFPYNHPLGSPMSKMCTLDLVKIVQNTHHSMALLGKLLAHTKNYSKIISSRPRMFCTSDHSLLCYFLLKPANTC